jgi:serine/threonine-protein kinase
MVSGRYRLDRLLGEGGFALVWAATHVVTERRVALKFLKGVHASDAQLRQRFLREARTASALSHANVIVIHDVFEDEHGPVMVMDLLEGISLGQRLKRDRVLDLPTVAAVALAIISALESARAQRVVHRDLKPDNVFLVDAPPHADRAPFEVKVLDFGIAKIMAREGDDADAGANPGLTHSGVLLGTPYYMSPEQIVGDRQIDHRSDVWSLGVILYECLAGVRPTEAETVGLVIRKIIVNESIAPLRTHRPDLPADVCRIVERALSFERGARPALRELHDAFARYLGAAAPTGVARFRSSGRGRTRRAWSVAALAVVCLGATGTAFVASRSGAVTRAASEAAETSGTPPRGPEVVMATAPTGSPPPPNASAAQSAPAVSTEATEDAIEAGPPPAAARRAPRVVHAASPASPAPAAIPAAAAKGPVSATATAGPAIDRTF